MSLEYNGVDQVHSLRKILTRFRGTNFCTSLAHIALSVVTQPNCPKCIQIVQTHRNMRLGSNGVDREHSLKKIPTRLDGTNFYTTSPGFARSFVRQTNSTKCTQIVQNTSKHEVRIQWDGSGVFVSKNSDTTSWHKHLHHFGRFARSFVRQTNSTKCTQIV